jgi:ferredoxin
MIPRCHHAVCDYFTPGGWFKIRAKVEHGRPQPPLAPATCHAARSCGSCIVVLVNNAGAMYPPTAVQKRTPWELDLGGNNRGSELLVGIQRSGAGAAMSLRAELVRLGLRWFVKRKIGPATTLEALRHQKQHYSISSSARPDSGSGTVMPSALAVLRLMKNSTFVACRTGRSAGLSPLRTRPV